MNRLRKATKFCLSFVSLVLHFNRRSKVLYLHDVHLTTQYAVEDCSMPINDFIRIVELIRKAGFRIVSDITEMTNQVMICFDDGYRGIWDCRNILDENGVFPTIFVATSLIDSQNYLTKNEIRHLSDMGFSIQSHSVSHKPLTLCDELQLHTELVESKKQLETITLKRVNGICLPLGYFNENVLSLSTELYSRTYLSIPGSFWDELDSGIIRRNLCQDVSPVSILLALFGGQDIMYKRLFKQHYHKNA